jgi:hypothetical protein
MGVGTGVGVGEGTAGDWVPHAAMTHITPAAAHNRFKVMS